MAQTAPKYSPEMPVASGMVNDGFYGYWMRSGGRSEQTANGLRPLVNDDTGVWYPGSGRRPLNPYLLRFAHPGNTAGGRHRRGKKTRRHKKARKHKKTRRH